GRDVDVAQVCVQEPAVIELVVHADLGGDAPGIVQAEIAQLAVRIEEGRVVQAHAHVGLERGVRQEVPLQAEGGRQLLGRADVAQALRVDRVLEGVGAQQLNADGARGHGGQGEGGERNSVVEGKNET